MGYENYVELTRDKVIHNINHDCVAKLDVYLYAFKALIPLLAAFTFIPNYSFASEASGAVGTFTYPLYEMWSRLYKSDTGGVINYDPVSSGEGLVLLKANKVTFSVSEIPLSPTELDEAGLVQWPQIVSGVVCIANIGGRQNKKLVLDGDTLSKIFLGEINNWDDPKISALNPKRKLPNLPITPVHRAGISGTNFIFDHYLSSVSNEWRSRKPNPNEINWPTGVAEKGNEGVARKVTKTMGAIGFVSFNYAMSKNIPRVSLVNKDGNIVDPSEESILAASQQIDWKNIAEFHGPITNMSGLFSWPIAAASYVLMRKNVYDDNQALETIKFFEWTLKKGAKPARTLGYIPAPEIYLSVIRENWLGIKGSNGHPIYH